MWSGLICLDWYDWNLFLWLRFRLFLLLVGIDLSGLIRLKPSFHWSCEHSRDWSGLICLDWYDWNTNVEKNAPVNSLKSGLICLDWYDWNAKTGIVCPSVIQSRDWSVWIDTIETVLELKYCHTSSIMSGLICLDWYDWNLISKTMCITKFLWSGLICLDWYDWNVNTFCDSNNITFSGRDWSVWIDTIETGYSYIIC